MKNLYLLHDSGVITRYDYPLAQLYDKRTPGPAKRLLHYANAYPNAFLEIEQGMANLLDVTRKQTMREEERTGALKALEQATALVLDVVRRYRWANEGEEVTV